MPTRSAEGGVKDIIHCPAIEIRFESPTENRPRAHPEGDIVKSGILQQDRDIPQLAIHLPGFSRAWHFRYVAIHKHLGPTAVLRRCAACAGDTAGVKVLWIECMLALETNIKEPSVKEIVLIRHRL